MEGTFNIDVQAVAAVQYKICKQGLSKETLEHGCGCGIYTVNYNEHTVKDASSKEIVAIITHVSINLLPEAKALVTFDDEHGWLYTKNESSPVKRGEVTGKYLFFSDNKKELVQLGKQLLNEYDLPAFKVPSSNTKNSGKGFGFVMCVYDKSDHLRHEMKQYATESISYRYWKSEELTAAGVYSNQFKATVTGQQLTQ